ncbi:RYamide receptor-like [Ylistrum balloti]|uniref:RYamide receptor-like n=1 Tax=Ylistrum balloti TaxID=509963 RepID=UPI00290587D1|nr:RYamide receptor-like [Ylistrum balloti]
MTEVIGPFYAVNTSFSSNLSIVGRADVDYSIPEEFQFTLLTMYAVTSLVVLLGNSMVCYTAFRIHSFRTVTNFFIVSLAITDIIMTLSCVPFSILSNLFFHYWPFWSILCPIVVFTQLVSVLLRSFMLVAMTCDRYQVARNPMKPHLLTKCRARILVMFICTLSCLISLPTFIYSKIIYMPYEPGSRGLCVELWPDEAIRTVYGVCIMLLQYFLPLIFMAVTYIHIGIIVWIKRTPGETYPLREERLAISKKKTIKMIFVVIVAYLLSWLPLHVITILGDLDQSIFDVNYMHMTWLTAHWLAFSNSGVNPVIYFWMNAKFRQSSVLCFYAVFRPKQPSFKRSSFRNSSKRDCTSRRDTDMSLMP